MRQPLLIKLKIWIGFFRKQPRSGGEHQVMGPIQLIDSQLHFMLEAITACSIYLFGEKPLLSFNGDGMIFLILSHESVIHYKCNHVS